MDAKENNTSDRHEGINHESRFNFSRRDQLSEDFAKMHEASCIICHCENDKRENFGEIYRQDGGNGPRREEKISPSVHKSVKRANLMERLE